MAHTRKPISERVLAKAVITHHQAPCRDGARRDLYKAVLISLNRPPIRLRPIFYSRDEALAFAEKARQRCIVSNRMPETMLRRQDREDVEEAKAEKQACRR